ncbi:Phosphate transport system permease protein PstA [Cystobacter fuscus DSM 2262]|uniref:Phosphate transport system permease protein PstA n=1 Tax=Cystobacter fuscus (strain ATCC 25194 / DSM 2262 / NBRC 100088 / M29) TaxID=1242864 RepID=S9QMV5_CYSF2|nr:Phosphate transport system permease protein PstA [Cystobacter fuscus DSM 2262]
MGGALTSLTGLAALLIVAMLAVILLDVVRGGAGHVTWSFLSEPPSDGMMGGGIFPALYGTAALTLLMTLAVMPVGVLTAVYLHEYAPPGSLLARAVRVAVVNLAGVPSIVFGLFGVGFFIHFVGGNMDRLLGYQELHWGQPGILWASLTLAVLTLPVVIVSTEEALRAVPMDHRTASLALGATQSQTLARVVLPGALPGILTGAVLAISRGAGEVAPILFTGAAYFLPDLPRAMNSQFMHLGYHSYVLATQSPDVEATRPLLYATVLVLLALTFALNLVAVLIRARTRRRAAAGH